MGYIETFKGTIIYYQNFSLDLLSIIKIEMAHRQKRLGNTGVNKKWSYFYRHISRVEIWCEGLFFHFFLAF
jgi:hypothetical protein